MPTTVKSAEATGSPGNHRNRCTDSLSPLWQFPSPGPNQESRRDCEFRGIELCIRANLRGNCKCGWIHAGKQVGLMAALRDLRETCMYSFVVSTRIR